MTLIHAPPGYTTTEEGYFLDVPTMQEVTAMVQTYRLQSEAWEKAYYDLNTKSTEFAQTQQKRLNTLQEQIDIERNDWKKRVRQAKKPGVGIFAGGGYTSSGFDLVIGVGFVWRIF